MRTVITTLIIWAIIIGFFASGVQVLATQPHAATGPQVGAEQNTAHRMNPGPSGSSDLDIRSADDVRGSLRFTN